MHEVQIQALLGDEQDTVGYSINLKNAYPIQVSQIELGEGVDGILEVTVTWEYDNWKTDDRSKDRRQFKIMASSFKRSTVDIEQGFI